MVRTQVEKILGPGNQYVTAAKMLLQNSEAMISMDMPAGPSEVLVIADAEALQTFYRRLSMVLTVRSAVVALCLSLLCSSLICKPHHSQKYAINAHGYQPQPLAEQGAECSTPYQRDTSFDSCSHPNADVISRHATSAICWVQQQPLHNLFDWIG